MWLGIPELDGAKESWTITFKLGISLFLGNSNRRKYLGYLYVAQFIVLHDKMFRDMLYLCSQIKDMRKCLCSFVDIYGYLEVS